MSQSSDSAYVTVGRIIGNYGTNFEIEETTMGIIPTEKTPAITELEQAKILIYGERKIGKTSLFSQFKNPLFLMFEPGASGDSLYQIPLHSSSKDRMENWKGLLQALKELHEMKMKGSLPFSHIVIDTADKMAVACQEYACERIGIKHPSDAPYGKGWSEVKTELSLQLQRLFSLGVGVGFTSHVQVRDFTSDRGRSFQKMIPTASGSIVSEFAAVADIIGFMGYVGSERYLIIEGNGEIECGRRLKNNFLTKNGERVCAIPMGNNDKEAYENLVNAFNNKQETPNRFEFIPRPDAPEKLGNK